MDAIDRKLLLLLQQDARTPLKQLAKEVFLSPPAVSARIEKMERDGVIAGYRVVTDPEKLGMSITAFVNLAMAPERQEAFIQFAQKCPNMLECYHVTGPYSMVLKVCFPGTSELDAFVGALQRQFGKTQTQVVFSAVVDHPNILLSPE